jgi:formamidopyrimidine-DNA glycosylase
MPELPELEVVREVLSRRLAGRAVERVTVAPKGGPIVVRDLTGQGLSQALQGSCLEAASRRGKFLILDIQPVRGQPLFLAANPKLTGRFQLCPPDGKKAGPVHVTLHFKSPDEELRFIDPKMMGQLYLTEQLGAVPTFTEMGPDALEINLDDFRERVKTFRGEIKGILIRAPFVAGIGNAYADEILWRAQLHPYRKRTSLKPQEVDRLFEAMRTTLQEAVEKVRLEMGEDIHLKPRDFFSVHMRGGEACPRCGTTISTVSANQRVTNFCRSCQPGGLIKGMASPQPPTD